MASDIVCGLIAGAAGTVALNISTYLDMSLRGRPASEVPAQLASTLTQKVGVDLAPSTEGDEKKQNRASGIGALIGYASGLGIGVAYASLRPTFRSVPTPVAGIGAGLAAMATSDLPIVAFDISDPKTWGITGWLSDIIPHLIYGMTVAYVYDTPTRDQRRLLGRLFGR